MSQRGDQRLSSIDAAFAFVGVFLALAPIVALLVAGENRWVQFFLGGVQLFIVYGILIILLIGVEKLIRRKIANRKNGDERRRS